MNKQIKYYKVIKACAGLVVGDVVVKTKGESAYNKLSDDSAQKVVYCICKKSLLKLQTEFRTSKTGDKILVIKPYMTSGEYKLGDVAEVVRYSGGGVDIKRSTGGSKWVSQDEYVIVTNWDGQMVLAEPSESHGGFKVGDMVTVVSGGKREGAFGVVHGFSGMNSPMIKFIKASGDLHKGNTCLKSVYKPLDTDSGWYIQTEDLKHFNEHSERSKRVQAAQDVANVEFDKELAALKAL